MSLFKIQNQISKFHKLLLLVTISATLVMSLVPWSSVFANAPGSVGTWNTNPINLPFSNSAAGVAVYNNYIYVTDRDTTYYAPFNANDSIGAWTTSPNHLPIAGDGALHEYNGYLYNVGARTNPWGTYYAKINGDASIGPWQTTTQLPLPLYGTNSFIYDGYLYVVGGTCFMWCAEMDSVYTAPINADGTVGSWTLADETLPYASSAAQIGVFGGYAYYVGGDANSTKVLTAPLGPNGYIGAWTEQTGSPLPAGTRSAATTIVNGYMFLAGGWTDANPNTNVFSAPLHPGGTLGTWSAQTSLPGPNGRAGATTHNGNLYIIGGQVNNFAITVDTILYNVVYGAMAANDPTTLGPTALTDNSYGTNNQPTFTFSQSDPNVSVPNVRYEIEVSTSNDFSNPVIDYTSAFGAQGSASFTVGQAAGSGTYNVGSSGQTLTDGNYYWRVRTTNEFLVSSSFTNASSGTTAFKVDTTAPSVPGTPSTTTPTTDTTPTWSWTASTDSASGLASVPYTVEWSQDNTFSSGVSSSTSNSTSFTQPSALSVGTWYFRTKATDVASNTSAYSPAGSVVINSPPTPPPDATDPPIQTPKKSNTTSPSTTYQTDTPQPEDTDQPTDTQKSSIKKSPDNVNLGNDPDFASGQEKELNLSEGQVVQFSIGEDKSPTTPITLQKVGGDFVTVKIGVDVYGRTVTINTGQTNKYDVDGDGRPDVSITLRGTSNGVAQLTFGKVKGDSAVAKPASLAKQKVTKKFPYWIIGMFVVLLIVFWLIVTKRRHKKDQAN